MIYLLDSQVLLWVRFARHRLPPPIISLIEDPAESVFYSIVTPWELSIKHTKGKIDLPGIFFESLPGLGFSCLAVEETHVDSLRRLPSLHHDPFDRMLVAQSLAERMTLITADKQLAAYPAKTLLIDA